MNAELKKALQKHPEQIFTASTRPPRFVIVSIWCGALANIETFIKVYNGEYTWSFGLFIYLISILLCLALFSLLFILAKLLNEISK